MTMYREVVYLNRLPNESGGDPTQPFKKVIAIEPIIPCTSDFLNAEKSVSVPNPVPQPAFFGVTYVMVAPPGSTRGIPRMIQFPILGVNNVAAAFEIFDAAAQAFCAKQNELEQEATRRAQGGIIIAEKVPLSVDQIEKAVNEIELLPPDKLLFGGMKRS
jgi:hypothetical protein